MNREKNAKTGALIAVVALVVVVVVAWFAYSALSPSASGQVGSAAASATTGQVGGAAASASSSQAGSTAASGSSTQAGAASEWGNSVLTQLTIDDSDGNPTTLESLAAGKVTVINVWATWCPYCVDEMQDFQGFYDKYGDRIQFVMLDSADDAGEVSKAHDYIEEHGFTFPVFYDTSWSAQLCFRVSAYPTTIVLDPNGKVLSNRAGRIATESFDEMLAGLVA